MNLGVLLVIAGWIAEGEPRVKELGKRAKIAGLVLVGLQVAVGVATIAFYSWMLR